MLADACRIIASGEKAVGSTVGGNAVQLVATPTPCLGVILMAPTVKHVTSVNADFVFAKVAAAAPAHADALLGGIALAVANYEGIPIPVDDASKVYLAGFVAGDAVEYLILG
jgi:hypothetical protein